MEAVVVQKIQKNQAEKKEVNNEANKEITDPYELQKEEDQKIYAEELLKRNAVSSLFISQLLLSSY